MSFDQIILLIMGVGILIGGVDKILDNKFGLGEKFEDGFNSMGPLALGMVGIMTLAPVIAKVLGPVLTPVFTILGADPAMFGAILANDMGGYTLAMELAQNQQAGELAGAITSSMLGCTIVFSIPVGLSLIQKGDRAFFAKGLLIGLISIPVGTLIGGMVAGFPMGMVVSNTIPVALLALILILGLKFIPEK
jgi:ethanolamine transporter